MYILIERQQQQHQQKQTICFRIEHTPKILIHTNTPHNAFSFFYRYIFCLTPSVLTHKENSLETKENKSNNKT